MKTYLQKERENALPKLFDILEDAFYNGKLHGMSPAEVRCLNVVYGDLLFENKTRFFSSKIKDVLEKCGITVKMSRDGVNYEAGFLI